MTNFARQHPMMFVVCGALLFISSMTAFSSGYFQGTFWFVSLLVLALFSVIIWSLPFILILLVDTRAGRNGKL